VVTRFFFCLQGRAELRVEQTFIPDAKKRIRYFYAVTREDKAR
jgi:hypothetical protein